MDIVGQLVQALHAKGPDAAVDIDSALKREVIDRQLPDRSLASIEYMDGFSRATCISKNTTSCACTSECCTDLEWAGG